MKPSNKIVAAGYGLALVAVSACGGSSHQGGGVVASNTRPASPDATRPIITITETSPTVTVTPTRRTVTVTVTASPSPGSSPSTHSIQATPGNDSGIQAKGKLGEAALGAYKAIVHDDGVPPWAGQVVLLDGSFSDTNLAIDMNVKADPAVEPLAREICREFAALAGFNGLPRRFYLAVISVDRVKMADCVG